MGRAGMSIYSPLKGPRPLFVLGNGMSQTRIFAQTINPIVNIRLIAAKILISFFTPPLFLVSSLKMNNL